MPNKSANEAQFDLIFLVGFMASGKSTIGPVLAARLGRQFFDLDKVIEEKEGRTIAGLIAGEGEEGFRRIETQVLRSTATDSNAVIAPGGGAVTTQDNRDLMSELGITVWLNAPFELCWQRIRQDRTVRPLAPDEESAKLLYAARLPLYQLSDYHIMIDEGASPDEISEIITREISLDRKV